MNSGRGILATGFTGSHSDDTANRRKDRKKLPDEEMSSFRISEDGSEFHFCHSKSMKVDFDLLKDYKSNLKYFGGYSEDIEGNFKNDKSFVRFLNTDYLPQEDSKEKKVHLTLDTIKEIIPQYGSTLIKNSENLFSWIVSNMDKLTEVLSCETKFVFLMEVFSKLLRIPYRYNDDANFYAVYLNGVIYLLNDKRAKRTEPDTLKIKQASRWNRKYRRSLTYGENDKEGVVHYTFYRSAMTTKLGPHNLLFSAPIDCFNPDLCNLESLEPANGVLLHCWPFALNNREMHEWWISLAAKGIPHVLVGFRNSGSGVVESLKLFTEDDLRRELKKQWNTDISTGFTFAENVLSFIENTTKKKEGKVFHFMRQKETNCIKAEETKSIEKFPPKWFTEELEKAIET